MKLTQSSHNSKISPLLYLTSLLIGVRQGCFMVWQQFRMIDVYLHSKESKHVQNCGYIHTLCLFDSFSLCLTVAEERVDHVHTYLSLYFDLFAQCCCKPVHTVSGSVPSLAVSATIGFPEYFLFVLLKYTEALWWRTFLLGWAGLATVSDNNTCRHM